MSVSKITFFYLCLKMCTILECMLAESGHTDTELFFFFTSVAGCTYDKKWNASSRCSVSWPWPTFLGPVFQQFYWWIPGALDCPGKSTIISVTNSWEVDFVSVIYYTVFNAFAEIISFLKLLMFYTSKWRNIKGPCLVFTTGSFTPMAAYMWNHVYKIGS